MKTLMCRAGVALFAIVSMSGIFIAQESALQPVTYASEGGVPIPAYATWVFAGAGFFNVPQGESRFSNVFVEPAAYERYIRTGSWPDRTVILSEKRTSKSTLPLTQNPGWGQTGAPTGFELEIKDASRGGWRYYTAAAGEKTAVAVPDQSACTGCHAEHAAVDNTFVQFYPSLADAAKQHHTYRAEK